MITNGCGGGKSLGGGARHRAGSPAAHAGRSPWTPLSSDGSRPYTDFVAVRVRSRGTVVDGARESASRTVFRKSSRRRSSPKRAAACRDTCRNRRFQRIRVGPGLSRGRAAGRYSESVARNSDSVAVRSENVAADSESVARALRNCHTLTPIPSQFAPISSHFTPILSHEDIDKSCISSILQ